MPAFEMGLSSNCMAKVRLSNRETRRQARIDSTRSAPRPIPVAGLHHQPFLFGSQLNTPEFGNTNRLIRHIAQTVLAAKLVLNDVENLPDGLLLSYFEETSTGLPGHPKEGFLAVGAPAEEAISA